MGILDELEAKKDKVAKLTEWMQSRPKAEQEEWQVAMARGDLYTLTAIKKLLDKLGHETDTNAIYRYRIKVPGYVPKN